MNKLNIFDQNSTGEVFNIATSGIPVAKPIPPLPNPPLPNPPLPNPLLTNENKREKFSFFLMHGRVKIATAKDADALKLKNGIFELKGIAP